MSWNVFMVNFEYICCGLRYNYNYYRIWSKNFSTRALRNFLMYLTLFKNNISVKVLSLIRRCLLTTLSSGITGAKYLIILFESNRNMLKFTSVLLHSFATYRFTLYYIFYILIYLFYVFNIYLYYILYYMFTSVLLHSFVTYTFIFLSQGNFSFHYLKENKGA